MVGLDVVLQTVLVLASNVALAEIFPRLPFRCPPTDHRACVAIGFHFVVAFDVPKPTARCSKALTALVAFIRRFPRVNPIVYCETIPPTKILTTGRAGERLLAGVDPVVFVESAMFSKTLATGLAFEWFFAGVDPIVRDEIAMLIETLTTCLASEWRFASMDPIVLHEMS